MTTISGARRRMAKLLTSDAAQYRISKLPMNPGEFSADVIEAYSADEAVARLDETEVFAVCEMAAKMRLRVGPGRDAALNAYRGRAVLTMGFAALHMLSKHICEPKDGKKEAKA